MGLCSLIANRGKSFDQFLDGLAQQEIRELTLQFRGSIRRPHTYRVRNIAYAGGRSYTHQVRSATICTKDVRLLGPDLSLHPALQEIVDAYVGDVQQARQKGFTVAPRLDLLAAYNAQYISHGMSEDLPKIRDIIEKRIS